VVGVNVYRDASETPVPILSVDPSVETEQIERLRAFRAARDGARSAAALARVSADAREDRNLMPALVEAVAADATLGEIVGALKAVYGEHRAGN
jgi:methylmalonyl-CoA mutase N-terminal domain/subunit